MRKKGISFILILLAMAAASCTTEIKNYNMLIGTYTHTDSRGIYIYKFNLESGEATPVSTMGGIENPSFLTVSGNYVYAVSETHGDTPGSISAYKFDQKAGKLTLLNTQPTRGDDPCYVEVDKTGKYVAVANYSSGSLILFQIGDSGELLPEKQFIQQTGSSINKDRQKMAHVHETVFSPDGKYLLTPDLGTDKVVVYRFAPESNKPLTKFSEIEVEPGSGPRHFIFHPTLPYAYLIQELSGKVVAYKYEGGDFTKIQELSALPEDFAGTKDGAEIGISPDGKFLYTSQRDDHNSITIYAIDADSGKLTVKGYQSAHGKGPRFFLIDPSGQFLIVANQLSDNIVFFKRDQQNGLLTRTGKELKIPIPVCVQLTPAS